MLFNLHCNLVFLFRIAGAYVISHLDLSSPKSSVSVCYPPSAPSIPCQLLQLPGGYMEAGIIGIGEVIATVVALREDAVLDGKAGLALRLTPLAFLKEGDEVLAAMPRYHRATRYLQLGHAHLAAVHTGWADIETRDVHHYPVGDELGDGDVASLEPTAPLDAQAANPRHWLPTRLVRPLPRCSPRQASTLAIPRPLAHARKRLRQNGRLARLSPSHAPPRRHRHLPPPSACGSPCARPNTSCTRPRPGWGVAASLTLLRLRVEYLWILLKTSS